MIGELLSSRASARHALFLALTAIAAATLLISDSEARAQTPSVITLSVTSGSPYIAEGDPGDGQYGGRVTITATLDAPAPESVGVGIGHYNIEGEPTASNFDDYRTLLAYFLKGQQTATLTIVAKTDAIDEPDEIIELSASLTFPTSEISVETQNRLRLIIVDDDGDPSSDTTPSYVTLTADDYNPDEGDTVTITATLNRPAGEGGVQVTISASDQSSASSDDYTLPTSSITIAKDATYGTTTITIADDSVDDDNEILVLNAAANGLTANGTTLIIADNDDPPVVDTPPLSDVATLSALTLNNAADSSNIAFTPTFNADTTSYSANVGTNVSQVTITPTTTHTSAIVTVKSNTVSSGSASSAIDIAYGSNVIFVVVTAEDGNTRKSYSIDINRPNPPPPPDPSPVPAYSPATVPPTTLRLSVDPQNPTEGDTVTITATLNEPAPANGTTVTLKIDTSTSTADNNDYTLASNTIDIVANDTSGTATITTNDDTQSESTETILINATSTNPSLNSNTIQIRIVDNDETPQSNDPPLSDDATLSALALTNAADSSNIDLTPTFDADTTSYSANVDANVSQVTITPTTTHTSATVTVSGNTVSSGSASNGIDIDYGSNIILVVVTAEDGSTIKTYSIDVNRSSPQAVTPSQSFSGSSSKATTITLTVDPQEHTEGGTTTITANLNAPAPPNGTTITLNVDTSASTADQDDYTLDSNTINIAEDTTSGSTTITIIDDTQSESEETIVINPASTNPRLNFNTIQIPITDNDRVAVYNPLILRVEPAFRNITLFAGDKVALEVHVYGRQNVRDDSLADDLNLEWDDDATGTFQTAKGLNALYYTPRQPGRYTVTATLPEPERNCYAFHEDKEKCEAKFNITARRPPESATPEKPPVNPEGKIPEIITDVQGVNYKVFTPVEGGTYTRENVTFSVPPSAVPDKEIIGINITKDEPASDTKTVQRNQYKLAGHWHRVNAIDSAGLPLSAYRLEKPAKICLPLPNELRTQITNVSIAQDELGDGNLTILTSNLVITIDGPIICATTSSLPVIAAIAITAEHAPQLPPAPIFQTPDETLPETGGLQPPHPVILILVIILTLAALITVFTIARQSSPSPFVLRKGREQAK